MIRITDVAVPIHVLNGPFHSEWKIDPHAELAMKLADKAYAAMIKTPGSLGTAPGGSSDSTEVQSKGTLGVRSRQVLLATPD